MGDRGVSRALSPIWGFQSEGTEGRHRGHPLPAGTRWEALWEFAKKKKKSHTHTREKKMRKKPNERLEETGDGFFGGDLTRGFGVSFLELMQGWLRSFHPAP